MPKKKRNIIQTYQKAVGDGNPKHMDSRAITDLQMMASEALKKAADGDKTINEIRAELLGLGPIPGGDKLPTPPKDDQAQGG